MPSRFQDVTRANVVFGNESARNDILADSMVYRPFIDGLRAVAVTAVVGSHVGIPGFSGGFIGVDIFFVISGFLIIGQIMHELKAGTFLFAKFWAKRTLRIIPPLLAMLLACSCMAVFIFVTPGQFREFGKELTYSATMLVNYYFLYKQDYFDSEAILKPLLHVWSLAIEEQFYLLAPIILFGLWKTRQISSLFKTLLFPVLACLAFLASLLACILFTRPENNFAFYAMPARAWEFIAGGSLIYLAPRLEKLPDMIFEATSAMGLAAIVSSIVMFNDSLPFPSYNAVLPVIGTALVIVSGVCRPTPLAIRLLAVQPLVAIGLVSYGWYLWHWPILSFTRIYNFGNLDLTRDIIAVMVGLIIAIVSFFVIERPALRLRRMKLSPGYWIYVVFGVLASSAIVSVAGIIYISAVATRSENAIPIGMRIEKDTKVMVGDPCWMIDPDELSQKCTRQIAGRDVVVLIGDSHARMLYLSLKERTSTNGMALVSLWRSGCSPFDIQRTVTFTISSSPKCRDYTERGLATLAAKLNRPPTLVVLGGFWSKILYGQTYSEFVRAGESPIEAISRTRKMELTTALSRVLDEIQRIGIGKTLVVGPSAELLYSPLDCAIRSRNRNLDHDFCNVPAKRMRAWLDPVNLALREATAPYKNAIMIDASKALCDEISCKSAEDDHLNFPDYHHVSKAGAELLFNNTPLGSYFRRD